MPLLVSALASTSVPAAQRRRRPQFDPGGRILTIDGRPLPDGRYEAQR